MYGYKCEYCDGIVQERVVEQEVFKHRDGFVILENVPIGVCNKCGRRYYHSTLSHRVEEIATRKESPKRVEQVQILEELKKFTIPDRLTIVEATLRLIREDLQKKGLTAVPGGEKTPIGSSG